MKKIIFNKKSSGTGSVESMFLKAACYFHFEEEANIKKLNLFPSKDNSFSKKQLTERICRMLDIYSKYNIFKK